MSQIFQWIFHFSLVDFLKRNLQIYFSHMGNALGFEKKTIIYAAMPQIKIDFKKEIEFVEFSPIFS